MTLMLINSTLFSSISNPLLMTLSLILQTTLICFMLNYHLNTPWYSIIICLIMLGGALIIFLYLSTLGPNTKMQLEKTKWTLLIPFSLIPFFSPDPLPSFSSPNNPSIMLMSNYLSLPLLLMFSIIMTLSCSSMILSNMKSPLRSITK